MVSSLRRLAQSVRHAPGLSSLGFLWDLLRKPYLSVLTSLGSQNGFSVTIGGNLMALHPVFGTLNWEIIETDSYQAFADTIKSGDIVYDIGAHIGTYTLIALRKSEPQGQVVAYEPHNITRNYLIQHLEWNAGRERTIVREVCCGAAIGITDFYYLQDEPEGMNSLVPVEGFEKKQVQVTTVDAEVTNLGLIPSIIKIDVEGAEWDVLKGAELTLRQYHPIIFLSLHPLALAKLDTTPEIILEWLTQLDYKYQVIAQDHEIHILAYALD